MHLFLCFFLLFSRDPKLGMLMSLVRWCGICTRKVGVRSIVWLLLFLLADLSGEDLSRHSIYPYFQFEPLPLW